MLLRHCFKQSAKWDLRSSCLNLPSLSPLVHLLNKPLISQKALIDNLIVLIDMTLPDPFFHKLPVGLTRLC